MYGDLYLPYKMEVEPMILKSLPISYDTDTLNVSFTLEFGKGNDSSIHYDSSIRTYYDEPYDVEKFEMDGNSMYRLLAEEGPFVMQLSNVNVEPKNRIYKKDIVGGYIEYNYGIVVVVDLNKEPVYSSPTSFEPSNDVERDGRPWFVKNNRTLRVDQNGEADFRWSTAKALEKNAKPTQEQIEMGVEERHENSGMVYITFLAACVEETHYYEVEEEPLYRGATRGITRGGGEGTTRGMTRSSAARVGYGSRAKTHSTSVNPQPVVNSRYILPIRFRTIGETSDKTKCAKDLKSAMRVDVLQMKTLTMPDTD